MVIILTSTQSHGLIPGSRRPSGGKKWQLTQSSSQIHGQRAWWTIVYKRHRVRHDGELNYSVLYNVFDGCCPKSLDYPGVKKDMKKRMFKVLVIVCFMIQVLLHVSIICEDS